MDPTWRIKFEKAIFLVGMIQHEAIINYPIHTYNTIRRSHFLVLAALE